MVLFSIYLQILSAILIKLDKKVNINIFNLKKMGGKICPSDENQLTYVYVRLVKTQYSKTLPCAV